MGRFYDFVAKKVHEKDYKAKEQEHKRMIDSLNDLRYELTDSTAIGLSILVSSELVSMEDIEIQRLMSKLENSYISAALKGLQYSAQQKIRSNLSGRLWVMICEDADFIRPVNNRYIAEALSKILLTKIEMENSKELGCGSLRDECKKCDEISKAGDLLSGFEDEKNDAKQ